MVDDLPVSLRDTRERAIATLSELFARDHIELEEFELRLARVHRAAAPREIADAMRDLPALASAAPTPQSMAIVPSSEVRASGTVVALMGSAIRRGGWTPPRQLRVLAVMGGSELDFRQARLPPGVTEVSVFALMGGVHIIVPPTLAVEVHGMGIMGAFEHLERQPPEPEPEQPILRVRGLCVMGGVGIETRLHGEGEREAQRRRRRERKQRRHRRRLGTGDHAGD